ncbi:MAG: sigma-54-dependent Fis family transcriptional regulator [Deltaproteobacteria bacterium]|nr:sigma-54-dependent Fis family transcriptional regulator [Deltaproteobacteria bacterium]
MNRILIYEPNPELLATYAGLLENHKFWVFTCGEEKEALNLIEKQIFHLCLWSAESSSGLDKIYSIKSQRPEMGLLVMSSIHEPSFVVSCIRSGASNFWVKSSEPHTFIDVITQTLGRIVPEVAETEKIDFPFPQFIGRHPAILEIFKLILSIKDTDSTVLITGESGTGKEVVARAIHNLSPRKKLPWVAINCGAIPTNLLESELFGHVKGAFTGATQNRNGRFQIAGSGTLFLDEISDLSFDLQAKILRAIQNKVYEPVGSPHSLKLDARIIAATNQDLEKAVVEKRFREDLFYRLNVIPIFIPPLRARKSDIPLLVKAFVDRFSEIHLKKITGIAEEAMRCLMQYQWPGNIRELENLIERIVVLKRDEGLIEMKDLPIHHFKQIRLDRYVANVSLPDEGVDFNEAVNDFENELIIQALQKTDGNRNKAATLLNLNRTTLVEKLKRKGLRIAS